MSRERTLGGVPADASGGSGGPGDSELAPYRSWALQKNVISLLGGESDWSSGSGAERPAAGPEEDDLLRGSAALVRQLEPDPEYRRRIRSMLLLWTAALFFETFNRLTSVGVDEPSDDHFLISGMIVAAIVVTLAVFPRLTFPQFIVYGQVMLLYADALIMVKVAGTGGMDSPYAVLWVLVTLYVAYFVARSRALPNIAFITAALLAPFVYDETASTEDAIYLGVLVAACWVLAYSVMAGRELQRGADRAVRYLALADPLTGVANLRSFEAAVDEAIHARDGRFALLVVDANGVRGAVAAFGHETGDDMLVRLSELLRRAAGERDQVARLRGDEFAVLIDGSGEPEARAWLERLGRLVREHNEWARNRLPRIEVETGFAVYPNDGENLSRLAEVADSRIVAARATVVRPPYEVDTAVSPDAEQLLRPAAEIYDPRVRQMRRASLHAGVRWLCTAAALGVYLTIPNVEDRVVPVIAATASLSLVLGLWGLLAQSNRRPVPYLYVSDVLTLLVIVPTIWGTGGWESPIQPAMVFPVAFYAQFMAGRQANLRVALAVALFSLAIWTSDAVGVAPGAPDEAALSLYVAVVTTLVVITAILQRSRRDTDAAIETIRRAATFDPLTGVRNVHAFRADLLAMIRAAGYRPEYVPRGVPAGVAGHEPSPALVIADVDDFRSVNTTSGHLAGDAVLKSVADRLRKTIAEDGTVYRIDADEFAVLTKVEGEREADELRERIEAVFARGRPLDREFGGTVSLSVGSALWRDGDSASKFVEEAESSLDVARSRRRSDAGTRGGATLL